jgi:hypothetical protein
MEQVDMKHPDMKELLTLARRGERIPHLEACSFCMEQYQLAVEFLQFSPDTVHEERGWIQEEGATLPYERRAYRLAAQSTDTMPPMFRLRRTWYFDNNSKILRVIEDIQRGVLTGFFITEREAKGDIRLRFDGIDKDFLPDHNGVFEIGSANINIEPMQVTLLGS